MRAAVYHPNEGFRIEDLPIPKIQSGEVLLKVQACGICGTDVLKVTRNLPKKPVVLGHELAGEVVEVGSGPNPFKIGDRIVVAHHVPCNDCHYCKHGHHSMCRHFKETHLDPGGFAEFLRIPVEHVQQAAFKIPKNLSNDEALFTEPLACCVRDIRRANLLPGDFAVVVGMGSVGLMLLQLLKRISVKVLALDLLETRLNLAKELGADWILNGASREIDSIIKKHTENRGTDIVLFTAGNGRVFQESTKWLRDGGTLNLFASLSEDPVPINLDQLYHREITIFSSYSPAPEDLHEAFRLISQGEVKVKELITHHVGLEQIQESIQQIQSQVALKIIVNP